MTHRISLCVALLAFLCLGLYAEKTGAVLEISKWQQERHRLSVGGGNVNHQTVVTEFTLRNAWNQSAENLKARVHYMAANGETVFLTEWKPGGDLSAGKTMVFSFSNSPVLYFSSCEVEVRGTGGGKELVQIFFSNTLGKTPEFISDGSFSKKEGQLIVLGNDVEDSIGKAPMMLTLSVKNIGAGEVREAEAQIVFVDKKGKELHSQKEKLGDGKVAPGKVLVMRIPLKKIAGMNTKNFKIKVNYKDGDSRSAEDQLSGGAFTEEACLEMGFFSFKREGANSLLISAKVRNGLLEDNPAVNSMLNLFCESGNGQTKQISLPFELPAMKAGEIRPIEIRAKQIPPIESLSYEIPAQGPDGGPQP